jgi:hypothetical protein
LTGRCPGTVNLISSDPISRQRGSTGHRTFVFCCDWGPRDRPPALESLGHLPQVVPWAIDRQKGCTQMPCIPWPWAAAAVIRIRLPECAAPLTDGVVGHDHPTDGHPLFDISAAEAEAAGQPDTVADDLRRETMAFRWVGRPRCVHAASGPHGTGPVHKRQVKLTVPARTFAVLFAPSPSASIRGGVFR